MKSGKGGAETCPLRVQLLLPLLLPRVEHRHLCLVEIASVAGHNRLEATRDLGTAWLRKHERVLLQVPSAIVPETVNFVFNPLHADALKFRIAEAFPYSFDLRLKM